MSNGSYTITPVKAGYTFVAPSLNFQVLNTDTIIQNYFYPTTAGTTTFNLQAGANNAAGAGICVDQPSCLPYAIAGVTINLTGTVELTGTTSSAGFYNFTVPNGYYHLTASLPNYVFVPAYSTVLISNAGEGRSAAFGSQFWGAQVGTGSHAITGEILGATSGPVTITVSGQQSATTTTDANGNFTFSNMPAGNYVLTPSLAGYTFGPASTTVTLVQYDSVANTFVVLSPPNPAPAPITGTPNILVNHTFDLYGPQCSTFWDSTQGWFPYITTDSQSGTYALEIACKETGKCAGTNPYIVTGGIPVPTPGKQYSFSGWGKCGGNINQFNTMFYLQSKGGTAVVVGGSAPANIVCDNAWHQSTFNINSGTEQAFNIGFMTNRNNQSLETAAKMDSLTLTYSDGTAPAWNVWRHPGRRSVYVTPQELFVDSKPYLALGTYAAPPWDYPEVASLGINTIASASTVGTTPTPECYNLDPGSIMDTAYENGLNMLGDVTFASRVGLDDGTTLHEAGSGGVLVIGNYTKQYSAHLANIGWFVDEPDLTAYDWYVIAPATFIQFGNAIRSGSPLPLITDFQGAHYKGMAYMHAYNGSAAMWETETYGAFSSLGNALYNLEAVQQRPAWFFQGSPATGGDQGYWNALAKSYYGLILGFRGIMYFAWNGFHATGSHCTGNGTNAAPCASLGNDVLFMNFITQASAELKSLTDPILSGTPIPGFKVVGGPAAMASQYRGQTFILSVTPVGGNYTANFTVPGLAAGTPVTVQFEGRTITSTSGGFTDTFTGQVRHVYVIGAALPPPPPLTGPAQLNIGHIGPGAAARTAPKQPQKPKP